MEKEGKIHLRRQVGLIGAVAIIIGQTIGIGIFVTPKAVFTGTQSVGLCLVVWAACGVISILGGLCYAELGTLVTKSGGDYAYLLEVYGTYPAFLYGFISPYFVGSSDGAIASIVAAQYLSAAVLGECGNSDLFVKTLACFILLSVTITTAVSTKATVAGNGLFTFLKLLAAGTIIVGGCVSLADGKTEGISSGFSGSSNDAVGIVEAIFSAFYTYSGWQSANFITEELKHSKRNLPRAIVMSILIIVVIYMAINISYFMVLGPEGVLASDAVAVSFEQNFLSTNYLMSVGVTISVIGGVLSGTLINSRIAYVAARDGHLPEFTSYVHVKRNTPFFAVINQRLLGFALIFMGDVSNLINFSSILDWVFVGMSMFSIILLRFKRKDAPRPYKVPILFPVVLVLVAITLVTVPLVLNPQGEYFAAIAIWAFATLVYIPFIYYKKSLPGIDKFTLWIQLLFQVAPSERNEDD